MEEPAIGVPAPVSATATCSVCSFSSPPSGEANCSLRDVRIADPDSSYCASHSDLTTRPDRVPVGPVMVRTATGNAIVHESPDNEVVRRRLLDIVEEIIVRDPSQLSLRQATAIWQLQEFGERRAHVHLDRILIPTGSSEPLPTVIARRIFTRIVGDTAAADPEDKTPFLERMTLRGRMLLLGSMIAAVAAFFGTLVLLNENLRPGTRVLLRWPVLVAFSTFGAVLAIGVFVFRRLGIPFMVGDAKPGDGAADTEEG